MKPLKVHILFEHGVYLRPYSSAFIRLLRPLTHPSLQGSLEVTSGLRYEDRTADVVILDRLWRPDITLPIAEKLVEDIYKSGARLIYSVDDNFLDLPAERKDWPLPEHITIFEYLLRQASAVWVTSPALQTRLSGYNLNIQVISQALDERLLAPRAEYASRSLFTSNRKTVIGYMGTFTHDQDMMMVLPALRKVCECHPGQVEFQLIGAVGKDETLQALEGIPFRIVRPVPEEVEYPLFMLWYTGRIRWDIAISPLRITPFTRCKSDIKFLDYSAIGAAGIYSRIPAYEQVVDPSQTGCLVDNQPEAWEAALEGLMADAELRQKLGCNAARYLYTQRILALRAVDWLEAVQLACSRSQTAN